jgi:PncC family amidohydrolase
MPPRFDRLALLPQGAQLLPAPSGEPAWTLPVRDAVVVVIPLASPHVRALIGEWVRPLARRRLQGEVRLLRALHTTGLSAGDVEERLGRWLGKAGAVAVSSAVVDGDVSVRLVARGSSRQAAQGELEPVERAVRSALGEECYGSDEDTLEAVVGHLLLDRAQTVAVAESCAGGLIGHRLTNVPGSSRYFDRAVVAYSNRAKEELLAVPAPLLRAHGAVSGPVADAMATAVRRLSGASWGLAVSGIAGPGGGTPAKPVGTVFVAAASPEGVTVRQRRLSGGREVVKWQAAQSALDLLRRALLQAPPAGR